MPMPGSPYGRQKLREAATVVDALGGVLEQNRAAIDRVQRDLHDAQQRLPRLELQLRALSRFGEPGSAQDPDNRERIDREIAETRATCDELRAELARLQRAAEQPRNDRRSVLAFVELMEKHVGDQGARARAELGGRAA